MGYYVKIIFDCVKPSNFVFRIDTIEDITYELTRNSFSNILEANVKDISTSKQVRFGINSTRLTNKEIFYNGLINIGITTLVYFASYMDFINTYWTY